MGDGMPATCGWCGARLPSDRAGVRRYCRPAHRQAAYRARRREARSVRAAVNPQVAMAFIAEDLTVQVEVVKELVADLTRTAASLPVDCIVWRWRPSRTWSRT
ncbi:hypothetical protein [Nocardia sp. NPDC051981]|uniref:hypothetical protein n=1 Tax=Nocardia sp. NPDC051981 TaxID=3155417 RepID=UPI003436BC05